MKHGLDRPGRPKDGIRVLRQSQKLYSRISPSLQFQILSPKGEIKSEANEKAVDSEKRQYPSTMLNQETVQYQKAGRNIRSPQNKWKKDYKLGYFKSEEAKTKIRSATYLHDMNLEKITNQAQQHRKDLIENQQRRAKISLQAAVAKKQLDFAERKTHVLALENDKLNLQLNLLRKQLLNLKENQQRLKRNYQVQLLQKHGQFQKNATLIAELQQNIKTFTVKTESIVKLQRQVSILMSQKLKANQQLQKLAKTHGQVVERNRAIEYNYKSLFQNHAKLQVSCQSLQRELHITKDYLSKTQALHCQTKEESFNFYQQKTKQLEQKSSIISSLKTQLSSLHQKIQKININEQNRQKLIDQLKTIIQNQKSNRIAFLLQKSKLQSDLTSLNRIVNGLQEHNQSSNEQIAKLNKMCQFQQQQLKEQEIYCQKMEQELKKSQIEWTLTLKHQLSRISDQKLQYITKLEQQLQQIRQINQQLKQKVSKQEKENQDLKQLLQKKQSDSFQYDKKMSKYAEVEHARHQEKVNPMISTNQNMANKLNKQQMKKEIEQLKFFKIKNKELENQLHDLSIQFRNESAKSNAERQKNVVLQERIKLQHQHIYKIQQQAAAQYSQRLRNLTLDFQKQKRQLLRQIKRYKKQNAVLKKELQQINSWLMTNNDNIKAIMQQLQQLKKRITNQNTTIDSNKTTAKSNGTITQASQQVVLENSNHQLSKKGQLNYSLAVINTEMLEMKRVLNILKQERQLFVKKYIQISNEVAKKGNAYKLDSQIKIMEDHFTQLSLLHTNLNNILLRAQNKLAQISNAQKSLQMRHILAQAS